MGVRPKLHRRILRTSPSTTPKQTELLLLLYHFFAAEGGMRANRKRTIYMAVSGQGFLKYDDKNCEKGKRPGGRFATR